MGKPATGFKIEDIRPRVGESPSTSSWVTLHQKRIEAFADATEDWYFLHVDEEAASQTTVGGTIAHGLLSLSLLPRLAADALIIPEGVKMALNYGFDRVRFLAPVKSGQRVRGCFTLQSVEAKQLTQFLMRHSVRVEIENEEKPALIAVWLTCLFTSSKP